MTEPYMGHVRADFRGGVIEWRLNAAEARALADALEDGTVWNDLARRDAAALRSAADHLDPRAEEPHDA